MNKEIDLSNAEYLKNLQELAERMRTIVSKSNSSVFVSGYQGSFHVQRYFQPERDEQGTLYGYKVLKVCPKCSGDACHLVSPIYWSEGQWETDGTLQADKIPTETNGNGIYFLKRFDDEELERYAMSYCRKHPVLVRCALSGVVIEGETGFRAEFAQIVGVFENGNWNNYQDSQECAFRNACYPSKKEGGWEYPPKTYPAQWRAKRTWNTD